MIKTITSLTCIPKRLHDKIPQETGQCPERFKCSGKAEYNIKIGKSETIIPAMVTEITMMESLLTCRLYKKKVSDNIYLNTL